MSDPVVIDLDKIFWESLLEAACQSKWMPEEYMVNDWASDCCNFLIEGPFDPEPLRKELAAAGRNNYILQKSMEELVAKNEKLMKRIEYLELQVGVIQLTIEDEAYKVTAGQEPCKHTQALNDLHELTVEALKHRMTKD